MLKKMLYFLTALGVVSLTAEVAPRLGVMESTQVKVIEKESLAKEEAGVREAFEKFANSDKEVLAQFDRFYASLQRAAEEGRLSNQGIKKILNATAFAAEKHKLQARTASTKTPYIVHPVDVADRVLQIGGICDTDVIVAALLHDVIDDTGTTYEEISSAFGEKVAGYVKEVTDPKELSMTERKKLQIVNAFHKSKGASVIGLADKMSNLNTLLTEPPSSWSRDRIDKYFQWAQAVVENLPEANPSLKKAVKGVIAQYWESQSPEHKAKK